MARANSRLLALTRAGHLKRSFIGTLPGGRIARYRKRSDRARWSEAQARHQLAINTLHLAFLRGAPNAGVSFRNWRRFPEALAPELRLVPDGYAEVEVLGKAEGCFVEVDQGTESRAVWRGKARFYVQLTVGGHFARVFSPERFRVLVVAPSERRERSIAAAIASVTPKLFYISTRQLINRSGPFSPVWLRPEGETRKPLF